MVLFTQARDPLGTRTVRRHWIVINTSDTDARIFQMEISVQRTIHREIDGHTLDVPLDDTPSRIEDDGASDKRSMHFSL